MNDDEQPRRRTQSEKDESLLFLGMFGIFEYARPRTVEGALRLFKPNSVLCPIDFVLALVPIEGNLSR
jgi:hypothetical protein